jgi:hypothetical protein
MTANFRANDSSLDLHHPRRRIRIVPRFVAGLSALFALALGAALHAEQCSSNVNTSCENQCKGQFGTYKPNAKPISEFTACMNDCAKHNGCTALSNSVNPGYTFMVGAIVPMPSSVPVGGMASGSIQVFPLDGYNGTVNLSCNVTFGAAGAPGSPPPACSVSNTPPTSGPCNSTSSVTFSGAFPSPVLQAVSLCPANFRGIATAQVTAFDASTGNGPNPITVGTVTGGDVSGGSVVAGGGFVALAIFAALAVVLTLLRKSIRSR